MLKNKLILISMLFLFILAIGVVSAAENSTDYSIIDDEKPIEINNIEKQSSLEETEPNDNPIITTAITSANIKTGPLKTYVDSEKYFQAQVTDADTNNPLKDVKVVFRVYSDENQHEDYLTTTNERGIASLNKNLNPGEYRIYTFVNEPSVVCNKVKSAYQVKQTPEWGCCSFYIQLSNTQSIAGFRRDSTTPRDLYIKDVNWHGRTAVKQYKNDHYFFHSITTADGWMIGTGGLDNPDINRAIEDLAGKMVESNRIIKSYSETIQNYEKKLTLGHFSIKAPDGRYAVVWKNGYLSGRLKPGEYISSPNYKSCYRHGNYKTFHSNPITAAIKIGATDTYGYHRRDITVFHWKSVTQDYQTKTRLKVYATNDAGNYVGRSTAQYKDNIHYKGGFISRDSLPLTPNWIHVGDHNFGSIDKYIKRLTIVKAPKVTNSFHKSGYFKIGVKDKKTKKILKNVRIKIRISNSDYSKTFTAKTNENGILQFNTKAFDIGKYYVAISSWNNIYYMDAKSTITIR